MRNIKKIVLSAVVALLVMPIFVLADFSVGGTPQPIANNINITPTSLTDNIINRFVWPIAFVAVIVLFIMAGVSFLTAQGDPEKLKTARKFVVWGLIGVVVIIISFSVLITVGAILNIVIV